MSSESEMTVFTSGARILFQGDSITDGNRGRSDDPNHILGHGYAFIIAARYGAQLAERQLEFMNRGVGGDKVTDLVARWQNDTIDLRPDILSVLIGVNDAFSAQRPDGVSLTQYQSVYDQLLGDARDVFPDVKLVLGEPFLIGAQFSDELHAHVQQQREIVANLAIKYGAAFVRYQQVFEAASQRVATPYWLWDGFHPTYSGHQLMADEWVRTVSEFKF